MAGCSPAKPRESAVDTLLVQEFPVEVPREDTVVNAPVVPVDTVYHDFVVEDNPTALQLDPAIVYVYKKGGLDLFEVNRDFKIEKVIGHVDYKSKVQLLGPLKNDMSLTVDGMKGYYALVQIDGGRMAYVFTGWLMKLPVPEDPHVFSYFLSTAHVNRARENGVMRKYEFEQGITLEHRFTEDEILVTIDGMTIQQGWLLANYFMAGLETFMKQMPTDSALIRVHPEVYYKVETKNGKVVRIIHEDGSGCHSLISITDTGKGVEIYSTIGC